MNNWKETILSEVADINRSTVDRNFAFNEIEYIDVASVENRKISQTQKVNLKDAPSRAKRIVRDNDILISTVRPNLRHYCFVKKAKPNLVASTGFAVVSAKENKANAYFLYNLLTTNDYTNYLIKIADSQTSTYPAFNPSIISNSKFVLPSFSEQVNIGGILKSLDDKIELLEEQNKTLEKIAQTIFKEWFINFNFPNENGQPYATSGGKMTTSDLGPIPEGWKVVELREMLTFKKGKKPEEIINQKEDGYLPQILIENLDGISGLFAKKKGMVIADRDDLLMVMDGASSGRIEIGHEGVVGSTLSLLCFKENIDHLMFFMLKKYESYFQKHTTGSAIPHTDKNLIFDLTIATPDNGLDKYNETFKIFCTKINENKKQIKDLSKLRDTLLPKLMSGEIRVK